MDIKDYSAAMRRAGRERQVEAMREGRRLRPVTIPSGKAYRRAKVKHGLRRETSD